MTCKEKTARKSTGRKGPIKQLAKSAPTTVLAMENIVLTRKHKNLWTQHKQLTPSPFCYGTQQNHILSSLQQNHIIWSQLMHPQLSRPCKLSPSIGIKAARLRKEKVVLRSRCSIQISMEPATNLLGMVLPFDQVNRTPTRYSISDSI